MFIYFSELVQIVIISVIASILTQIIIKGSKTSHKKLTLFLVCLIGQLFIDYTILLYVPYNSAKPPYQMMLNEFACVWLEFIMGMVFYDNCLKDIYKFIGRFFKKENRLYPQGE